MNRLSIMCLLFIISACMGCSSVEEKDMPRMVKKSHKIAITGTVNFIDRIDADKSGKNPKYILQFTLKVESYDDSEGWAMLGSIINCTVKERTVIEQTGKTLKSGDRVIITSNIIDLHPEVISVQRIKFADK